MAEFKKENYDLSKFMCQPITEEASLCENVDTMRSQMELLILRVQADICRALEQRESKQKFKVFREFRSEGGGTVTTVMEGGEVWEKAGISATIIDGGIPHRPGRALNPRFVAGISGVIYPRNPHIPTIQFSYRYQEGVTSQGEPGWAFAGNSDFFPLIFHEEDVTHYHKVIRETCDQFDPDLYPQFKATSDDYFKIKHRGETRGLGGIFFENLNEPSANEVFQFVRTCAEAVLTSYLPIVDRRMTQTYTDSDREWQLIRRGRYVEFNLLYDRGTVFGLQVPGAKIENIFMALPPTASWRYDYRTESESDKRRLQDALQHPQDWA